MTWHLDQSRILTRSEYARVLADLRPRAGRRQNLHLNLAVFRLAACCGLRVREIACLKLGDVHVGIERPFIWVHGDGPKGGHGRRVPLWWDHDTLADLTGWIDHRRLKHRARDVDFVICSLREASWGRPLDRFNLRKHFRAACRALGSARQRTLTIHHGRHSFISHALAGGRTIAEVQAAAGHSSTATTAHYVHIAVDDDGTIGSVFAFKNGQKGGGGTQTPA